jgi:hypothetical protein
MGIFQDTISFLGPKSVPFVTAGATYGAFAFAERIASEEAKAALSTWIHSLDVRKSALLPTAIQDTFNRIFGVEHFSITCFRRSVYFSVAAVVLTTFIYFLLHPNTAFRTRNPQFQTLFWSLVATWILVSIIYDYLNLLKTRIALDFLTNKIKKWIAALAVLIIDPVFAYISFTALFSVIGLAVAIIIFPERLSEFLADVRTWAAQDVELLIPVIKWEKNVSPLFYAGMLPSIWLWFFIASLFLARLLIKAGPVVNLLRFFLDIKKKPFRSVGVVTAALVFAGTVLVLGIGFVIEKCCA